MKHLMTATAVAALTAGAAVAGSHTSEVKLGVMMGFTGPAESLVPPMADAAELAMSEASESGMFLDGTTITPVRGDTGCIDASMTTATAERLITSDGVVGIMGAACSGASNAALVNVAVPNGVVMISPSSTSPALSVVEDNGLFFRTAPSDARQGQVMTEILMENGVEEVAVTYTNNDYGKGLSDSFEAAFTDAGGTVTINIPHDDGKADYSAEVASLASAGGDRLVVIGYIDQGGSGIVRAALDAGAFDFFHFPDGMTGPLIEENFGTEIEGSTGQVPGTDSPGSALMLELGEANGFDGNSPYAPESYDAAALMILAMQAAGSTDPAVWKEHVMDVANAPGEPILPGELAKALEILADGGEIDYIGGSAVELIGPGESAGAFRQFVIEDGMITTVQFR